jgi:hypothetical protein
MMARGSIASGLAAHGRRLQRLSSARAAAGMVCLALLAACSQGGSGFARYEDVGRLALGNPVAEPSGGPDALPLLPRASFDLIDAPIVGLGFTDAPTVFLSASGRTEDHVSYQDQNRRGIRMRGGAVAATYGFGVDLRAVRFQREDPVATPTPLEQWPGQVDREYQYRVRDLDGFSITVTCVFDRLVRENIVVVERTHEVVRVVETCTNQRRSFENTYWVEPETGFIWRSAQWTGPSIRPVTVDIVNPAEPRHG